MFDTSHPAALVAPLITGTAPVIAGKTGEKNEMAMQRQGFTMMRSVRRLVLAAVLCCAMVLSLCVTAPVLAATRQVVAGGTNSGDCISAACGSIAYAITQAVAGDGISIGAGTYNEANLTITKNLTITGAGAANTTIDAQLSGRGFYVNAGVTAAVSNLTVQHGYPGAGNDGGGVDNLGTLTLTNVIITAGGVRYYSNSQNYYGTPGHGGGIANSGTLSLVSVTVSNNVAGINGVSDAGYGTGGQAAGLYNTGTLYAQGSTFSGNLSNGPLSNDGGAIYNRTFLGRITMSYSTITNNESNTGSAIFADNFMVNNSTATSGPIVLDHVTVSNNRDAQEFGAIYVSADLTITNCTITGNTAVAGHQGGGGIDAANGSFTMSDSTVSNNTSNYGNAGGVNVSTSSPVSITRSVISGNGNTVNLGTSPNAKTTAATGGLLVGVRDTSFTLTDSQITGNTGNTGGVQVDMSGSAGTTATIRNTTINGNTGTVSQAPNLLSVSGLFISGGVDSDIPSVTINNSTVSNNTGSNSAGGIYTRILTQITGSTISGNSGDGFVTTVVTGSTAPASRMSAMTNSTVSDNIGRGIVEAKDIELGTGYTYAPLVLTNDTVVNNNGGVALTVSGSIVLKNTLLKNTSYNCAGALTTAGYNLDSSTACFLPGGTDLRGVDPKIGPLGSNGGPTLTHALQLGSPAIDAIPATGGCNGAGLTTDQRGVARPSGAGCEIGAVELTVNTQPSGHVPAPTVGAPAAQPPLTGSHPAKPTVPAPPMAQPARH